jgi:hypothetical protein
MNNVRKYLAVIISVIILLSITIPAIAMATEEPLPTTGSEDEVVHITDAELPLVTGPGGSGGSWALWNFE